jgi:hypothetical protein
MLRNALIIIKKQTMKQARMKSRRKKSAQTYMKIMNGNRSVHNALRDEANAFLCAEVTPFYCGYHCYYGHIG